MYASVGEYLYGMKPRTSNLSKINEEYLERFTIPQQISEHISEKIPVISNTDEKSLLGNTNDPKVWGPYFWTTYHISSAYYPEEASPIVRELTKCKIKAIPYEIPCEKCRIHAIGFIDSHLHNLDDIVKGRDNLFKFYVDFHNFVNKRYNKPIWSYDQAYQKYRGGTTVNFK